MCLLIFWIKRIAKVSQFNRELTVQVSSALAAINCLYNKKAHVIICKVHSKVVPFRGKSKAELAHNLGEHLRRNHKELYRSPTDGFYTHIINSLDSVCPFSGTTFERVCHVRWPSTCHYGHRHCGRGEMQRLPLLWHDQAVGRLSQASLTCHWQYQLWRLCSTIRIAWRTCSCQ